MYTTRLLNESVSGITYTDSFDLYRCRGYSYQVKLSNKAGIDSASVLIQASNNDIDWTNLTDSGLVIVQNNSTDVCFLEDADVSYRYVRLKIDPGAGSFTAQVWFNAQEGVYS